MYSLPGGAVTALGITQLIGWGTTFYIPAVLAHVIADDTGLSLTVFFAAFSWNLLVAGAVASRIGRLIDAHGARAVMSAGSVVLVIGLLVLASTSHWLQLFVAWTILGVSSRATQYDAAFSAIAVIKGAGARRAISMVTLWGGLASTVFWPVGHLLGESLGWRWALVVYALLNLAICLPLHMRLPRRDARPDEAAPAAPAKTATGVGAAGPAPNAGQIPDAIRDRALLVFAGVLSTYSFVFSALSAHLIVLLEGLGVAAAAAVAIASVKGMAQVAARFMELIGQRWFGPIPIGVFALGLLPLSLAIMLAAGASPLVLTLACVIYGAANGLVTIVRGAVPLALFGTTGYATILGRIAAPGLATAALAPLAFAWVLENAGVDAGVILLGVVSLAGFAGMIWLSRRPFSTSRP